jgi:hypothetical protein
MSNSKTRPTSPPRIRTPHEELAREAAEWDDRTRTPAGFADAPDAIPNASRSVAVSIRIPVQLLELLKIFAGRNQVGYQVLIKKWLDDRLRAELEHLRKETKSKSQRSKPSRAKSSTSRAPGFPLKDRADPNGPHYDYALGES